MIIGALQLSRRDDPNLSDESLAQGLRQALAFLGVEHVADRRQATQPNQ